MKNARLAYQAARIFDGAKMWHDHALLAYEDASTQIVPVSALPDGCPVTFLDAGTIMPGFIDLQVNGGGGIMFNDAPTVETLVQIADAHRSLGTAAILPTLITDTPVQTQAAIAAVTQAIDERIPGIAGLHLEGPHLSIAKKGAHDASLIRPMTDEDLTVLLVAAERIANLMVTVAPETVTPAQITELSKAGIIVSLGHSDCDYATAMAAFDAGARCATHLFNAMSQSSAREPGMVGAAMDHGSVASGLIADGEHVHPAMIRTALAANRGTGGIFLVTDAMATAGSDIKSFMLNGREILRSNGRLTLSDGTLAGADLTMPEALRFMVDEVGAPLDVTLARATSVPANLLREPPQFANLDTMIWLSDDFASAKWLV